MIYNKDAVFPYPILSETSNSYLNNSFILDITGVKETNEKYIFLFSCNIGSSFIVNMLKQNKAVLIFIIQSEDNIFEEITYYQNQIEIRKERLSLNARTKIQLQIQSRDKIYFAYATDLNNFYDSVKDKISVKKHSLLGYSNESILEGCQAKPLELFEQTIREDLEIPFQVELRSDTINLVFQNQDDSLTSLHCNKNARNMYIYLGLNRAITDFINEYITEDEESIVLNSLPTIDRGLHLKLRDLMINKNITEIRPEKIDSIIQSISDKLIEKFSNCIKEMSKGGD